MQFDYKYDVSNGYLCIRVCMYVCVCPFITNHCSHGTWRCENSRREPAKCKLPALVNLCQLNARLKETAAARKFPRH